MIEEGTERSRLFRFNWQHPMAEAISGLFRIESDRVQEIFEAIKASAASASGKISSMWIYGSVARREDRVDSDVDIGLIAEAEYLAETTETVRENLREEGRRLAFLPNVAGLDLVDVQRLARDDDPWWRGCIEDAIVLLGEHPEDIGRRMARKEGKGQDRAAEEARRNLR